MNPQACPNNHNPKYTEIRDSGARICTKCRDHYSALNRNRYPAKVTPKNVHRTTV